MWHSNGYEAIIKCDTLICDRSSVSHYFWNASQRIRWGLISIPRVTKITCSFFIWASASDHLIYRQKRIKQLPSRIYEQFQTVHFHFIKFLTANFLRFRSFTWTLLNRLLSPFDISGPSTLTQFPVQRRFDANGRPVWFQNQTFDYF